MKTYFSVSEITRSETAVAKGIQNEPNTDQMLNIARMIMTLNKLRACLYGKPIRITSGFRSEVVNLLVGGVPQSTHMAGRAVDLQPWIVENSEEGVKAFKDLADALVELGYDCKWPISKIILEKAGAKRWIHAEIPELNVRGFRDEGEGGMEIFVMDKGVMIGKLTETQKGWATVYKRMLDLWMDK